MILTLTILGTSAVPATCIVLSLLYLLLRARNRPLLWLLLVAATATWAAFAVHAFGLALQPQPRGPDALHGPVALALGAVYVVMLGLVWAPSFPALAFTLVLPPRDPIGTVRRRIHWLRVHPYRNYILLAIFLAAAALIRTALWLIADV